MRPVLDIGLLELLLLFVPILAMASVAYWVIRLAVRHGTLDAHRVDQRAARKKTSEAESAHGGSGPE